MTARLPEKEIMLYVDTRIHESACGISLHVAVNFVMCAAPERTRGRQARRRRRDCGREARLRARGALSHDGVVHSRMAGWQSVAAIVIELGVHAELLVQVGYMSAARRLPSSIWVHMRNCWYHCSTETVELQRTRHERLTVVAATMPTSVLPAPHGSTMMPDRARWLLNIRERAYDALWPW